MQLSFLVTFNIPIFFVSIICHNSLNPRSPEFNQIQLNTIKPSWAANGLVWLIQLLQHHAISHLMYKPVVFQIFVLFKPNTYVRFYLRLYTICKERVFLSGLLMHMMHSVICWNMSLWKVYVQSTIDIYCISGKNSRKFQFLKFIPKE